MPTFLCAIAWAEINAGLRPAEVSVTEAFFQARGEVLLAAAVAGLQLWTLNRRHYPMPELRFFSPR